LCSRWSLDSMHLEVETQITDDRPVFLTGDFCQWNPSNPEYRMDRVEDTLYRIPLDKVPNLAPDTYYKYTKGGWDHAELDVLGNSPQNRKFLQAKTRDFVPLWRKDGFTPSFADTFPLLEVFDEEIPQLKRTRKISVLLPHDYYEMPEKRYPVLYMNDAQNLFGEGSAYGNWDIDKRLSLLAKQGAQNVIVVAIDHGVETRNVEYSPYKTPKGNQKGEGMRYATFIVRTLKPLIDARYRTLKERQFTGIGGSSMGGLISIYTGMMYPESIGRLMVFSPALWTSPKIYFDAVEFFNPMDTRIYLYGGGKESLSMFSNLEKLISTIEGQGFSAEKIQIRAELDPEGLHNEKRWGQEFPKALQWLF
jgi:predicted alpha/beta superfamily hydrolase